MTVWLTPRTCFTAARYCRTNFHRSAERCARAGCHHGLRYCRARARGWNGPRLGGMLAAGHRS
jgi:hypothetical protein